MNNVTSAKINLEQYYERLKTNFESQDAKAKSEQNKITKEINKEETAKRVPEDEKNKKMALLNGMKAEKIDTTEIYKKISDLDAQIKSKAERISNLCTQRDQVKKPEPFKAERLRLLIDVLAKKGCLEVSGVERVEDCLADFQVGKIGQGYLRTHGGIGVELDNAGRPIFCSFGLAGKIWSVKIESTKDHFFLNFHPSILNWLPNMAGICEKNNYSHQDRDYNNERKGAVYLNTVTDELFLSNTELTWSVVEREGRYNESKETFTEDFSDVAISLCQRIEAILKDSNETLNLDADYKENPLFRRISSEILSLTTTETKFRPSTEKINTETIQDRIKDHWTAFVAAPWSGDLIGTVAILKYHLENGERARFWCGGFENVYGYKLRTRDHGWISGLIYILEAPLPKSDGKCILIHNKGSSYNMQVSSVGRLLLSVHDRE